MTTTEPTIMSQSFKNLLVTSNFKKAWLQGASTHSGGRKRSKIYIASRFFVALLAGVLLSAHVEGQSPNLINLKIALFALI
jgi:hypothetical protein